MGAASRSGWLSAVMAATVAVTIAAPSAFFTVSVSVVAVSVLTTVEPVAMASVATATKEETTHVHYPPRSGDLPVFGHRPVYAAQWLW